jgi:hypothetical protein
MFFLEEVEKALLRSLSPVKKDESNEAIDFLNSFLSKSEEKRMVFPSISREHSKTISRTASTFDGRISSTSIEYSFLNLSKIGEGDYKPSAELLDLFSTLPDASTRRDVVVKSETLDTVLRYGMLRFSISLLFFDCHLTAIQRQGLFFRRSRGCHCQVGSYRNRNDVWYVMPFDSNYLRLNHYTHLIR